jgi:hypothetical protein
MSKSLILLIVLVSGALALQSPQTSANTVPASVVLADGTVVKLRMGSATTPGSVRVGTNLELEVVEDVRVNDILVIAKGDVASAEVTNLRSGMSSTRGGWIDINLETVALIDGARVAIRASKAKPLHDTQETVVSSSGQDASITQGTDLIAYINGSQTLDVTRLRAASGPTTEVKVTSMPPNAEITVDGRLAGNTPYTLHVGAGDHELALRMVGFQPWQNKIHVAAQPVVVDVPLTKLDGTEPVPASKPNEPSLGDLARAARARKPQTSTAPRVMDPDGQTSNQNGQRDPMQQPKQ